MDKVTFIQTLVVAMNIYVFILFNIVSQTPYKRKCSCKDLSWVGPTYKKYSNGYLAYL